MAAPVLTFTREPVTGGDLGAWAPYLIAQTRGGGLGALSLELYDNGGDLKMREGFAGINDGVVRGMIECTTDGTISTVGMTANNWHQVEMSVSGAAVTLSISAIAGETDESLIPATVKAAYNAAKQGYYMTASKRLVGVVFLRTALALGRVVNCENGKRGFRGITEKIQYDGANENIVYIDSLSYIFTINLDTVPATEYDFPYYVSNEDVLSRIHNFTASIMNNAGTQSYHLTANNTAAAGDVLPELSLGKITVSAGKKMHFVRPKVGAGGTFDAAGFNAAQMIVEVTFET